MFSAVRTTLNRTHISILQGRFMRSEHNRVAKIFSRVIPYSERFGRGYSVDRDLIAGKIAWH